MNRAVHFEILADDPARVSSFYHDVLGWEIASWAGNQSYWLATTGPEGNPGINGGFMHRHFPQAVINTSDVESLEATIQKVEAAGGRLVHGPNDVSGIGRQAYCADPEGNLFGLMEFSRREQ